MFKTKKILSVVLALVIIAAAVPLGTFDFEAEAASSTTSMGVIDLLEFGEYLVNAGSISKFWDSHVADNGERGTRYDPIIIDSAEEFFFLAKVSGNETAGKYYKVADGIAGFDLSSGNLNLNGTLSENLSRIKSSGKNHAGSTPGFQGHFDGNGATVYGAWTNHISVASFAGLFSCVKGNVTIKNINVKLASFTAKNAAGGIVGYHSGDGTNTLTIENCSVTDSEIVSTGTGWGNATGAIVGFMNNCTSFIDTNDTDFDGNTTDRIYVNGGLNIRNCYVNLDSTYFKSGMASDNQALHGGVAGFCNSNALKVENCVVIGIKPYATTTNTSNNHVQHSGLEFHFTNVYTDQPAGSAVYIGGSLGNRNFTGRVTQLKKTQMQGSRAIVNMPNLAWGTEWYVGSTGQYPTPIRPRYYTVTNSSGSSGGNTTVPTIDVKNAIKNITPSSYAIKGFNVEIFGKQYSLLDFEAKVSLNITDNIKVIVDDNRNIKVLLGFDEGAKANIQGANKSDTYWSDSYKEVKKMYQDFTGNKVDTTKLWNDFSKMRGKLKKIDSTMVVKADANIAGYIEYTYTNSGYKFSEGGVLVGFDASAELVHGQGVFFTLGIGGGANGALTFTNTNNELNTELTVSPNLRLTVGAGIGLRGPGGTGLYGKVEGSGNLQAVITTNSSKPFSAGAYLSARGYAKLLWGEIEFFNKDFSGIELYPNFGDKWIPKTFSLTTQSNSNADDYYNLINSATPINRSYLTTGYSLRRNSTYTNASFVKENLYPVNSVRMVKFDNDNLLLVWVDDLGTKTTNNMGTLMYSYFDGVQWSEPNIIYEDGTHNDMPSVYSDGKLAYIVWQKANTIIDDDVELSEAMKNYDLYATTFDSATKTFNNIVCINHYEDTVFEFNPQVYGKNGKYVVTWAENSDNNVFLTSGENKLCSATVDPSSNSIENKTIVETSNAILCVDIDDKIYYSVCENEINNVYCYDYENTALVASNVDAFDYENGKLFYLASDCFYSYDGENTVLYDNLALKSTNDFKIVFNGDNYTLFTAVLNEDFSKTLYYSRFATGAHDWTDLEVYSNKGKYIRNFSPVMLSDGNVQVAFNYYDEATERAALVVENSTTDVDVTVNYVDFDESQLGNETIDFEIGIKNNNSILIDSFTVEISDSTGVLSTQTVVAELSAFEEKEISVAFTLPENYKNEKYSFRVIPNGYTDINEENNVAITTIECIHMVEWVITTQPTETTDGVETQCCTKCGEVYDERVLPRLKFAGASLTIYNNISVNYKVEKSLFEQTGYLEPYVILEFNGKQYIKDKYTIVDDYYVFTFNNITPNKINDTIKSTLCAVYGNKEYIVSGRDYSVAQYCYNMLAKCTDDKYGEFRTLLVDLLNYGAQSQIYTDYNTDNLANAQLTDAQKAWGTQEKPTLNTVQKLDYETIENPSVLWRGGGLVLDDSVTMRFIIQTDNIENLSAKVTVGDKTYTVKCNSFKSIGNNLYYIYFNNLNASQMSETVYLTIYNGDTAVSNTLRYSIESYAYAKVGGDDTKLSDLLIDMMKYGNAAYNYVN